MHIIEAKEIVTCNIMHSSHLKDKTIGQGLLYQMAWADSTFVISCSQGIEKIAWNASGERLAVSFKGGDEIYRGLIAIYDARRTPVVSTSLVWVSDKQYLWCCPSTFKMVSFLLCMF